MIPSCDFTKRINSYNRISNNQKKKIWKIFDRSTCAALKNRFKVLL